MDSALATNYRILPVNAPNVADELERFSIDVIAGLSAPCKRIPPRYFYDDEGSRIFSQIMDLPSYYLTDAEHEILQSRAKDILAFAKGRPLNLVDLGAGDGRKTMHLLRALQQAGTPFCYVPIDASEGAMATVTASIKQEIPGVHISGLVGDYFDALHWLKGHDSEHLNLVLFLGSNIGNFDPRGAHTFATRMQQSLRPGDHVLIGFDLRKDPKVLRDAYQDPQGVTTAFNMNLLARRNRELGANFDLDGFSHHALYNPTTGGMESHLIAKRAQKVTFCGLRRTFDFKAWEGIHTECSYKYWPSDADTLAARAGFLPQGQFFDEKRYFMDALWVVTEQDDPTDAKIAP